MRFAAGSGERGEPELFALRVDDQRPGGRGCGTVALAESLNLSRRPVDGQNLLLDARRVARRVRVLARAVLVAAAHEDNPVAVGAETQVAQLLTVVTVEVRQLAGLKLRPVGDPDVASAFGVEGPGDALAAARGGDVGGEGRTQNLFEREASALPRGDCRTERQRDEECDERASGFHLNPSAKRRSEIVRMSGGIVVEFGGSRQSLCRREHGRTWSL